MGRSSFLLVSFVAVFWAVTQRSFWGERCVTAQKTAAKETSFLQVIVRMGVLKSDSHLSVDIPLLEDGPVV